MRNQRKIGKTRKNAELLRNHIKRYLKEYIISTVILLIGIIVGVIMVNRSTQENRNEITGYINHFIETIKNEEYTIDGKKLLQKSILSNVKLAFFIWIVGSTIIGLPLIYSALAYKGFCIGYSISAIIGALGKAKGAILSLSTMLLPNIIAIPCILALTVSSVKMYRGVIKTRNKEDVKIEIHRHTLFCVIMTIGLLISSLVEYIATSFFMSGMITKFV